MTTVDAFLADIIANPADDTPRLIYADWLDEHDQPERAEFIRVQCELAPLTERDTVRCPRCLKERHAQGLPQHQARCQSMHGEALRRRERELLQARNDDLCNLDRWLLNVLPDLSFWQRVNSPQNCFRRGFVDAITCKLADWIAHGPTLVRTAPLERVSLTDAFIVRWSDGLCHLTQPREESLPFPFPPSDRSTIRSVLDALSAACLAWARSCK